MKLIEQWYAGVMQKRDAKNGEDKYYNVCMWDNARLPGQRYYQTREDAQKALDHAYTIWNREKKYDANGKRTELVDSINGLGISLVSDKKMDDDMRIVKHIIKKRMVSEWEIVEKEELG